MRESGDEAVPCFAPGGFGGEVLEDARLFSFNAAALRLLSGPGFKSDCCAPQLAGESCSATDVMATCDGFCELRGWQAG